VSFAASMMVVALVAGPPSLPPKRGASEPAPKPPARAVGSSTSANSDPQLDLPREFQDPAQTSSDTEQEQETAVVVVAPDEPPPLGMVGDPRVDRAASVEGATGPGVLEYETLTAVRTAEPAQPSRKLTFQRGTPPPEKSAMLVIGYRQFAMRDGLDRDQTWHLVGIEIAPVRRYVRFTLHTEVGVEGGEAATGGDRADLMVLQKVGLGMQYPYWVTPFVEVQVGVGAARIELFERNDLAAIYTVGLDVGVQWALLKHLDFVGSVGWIRPYFAATGTTVYSDQATFRVGIGF